jgi:hypothetical protein
MIVRAAAVLQLPRTVPSPAPSCRPRWLPCAGADVATVAQASATAIANTIAGASGIATVITTLALASLAAPAQAQQPLPRRNLLVEVRVVRAVDVDPDAPRATTLSTRSLADDLPPPQQLRMVNGQRGQLRYSRKLPLLWPQAIDLGGALSERLPGGGADGAASYRLIWLDAGQSLAVQASWPGGMAPARIELSLGAGAVEPRAGQPVPARQTRGASTTTLVTPMARWTTFAALGTAAESRSGTELSTRSLGAARERQVFQVRVSAD